MNLNTDFLRYQIKSLQSSLTLVNNAEAADIDKEIAEDAFFRAYEATKETVYKLLKKALKQFAYGPRKLDTIPIKEILRLAGNHGLMAVEEVERWFVYFQDYREDLHPDSTLALIPAFIADATNLETVIRERGGDKKDSAPDDGNRVIKLAPRYLQMLRALLERYLSEAEVWAYGSRVNGDCHEGSDIDLVVLNPATPGAPLDLLDLKEALVESSIPIRVDVVDWVRIPEAFRREIERAYVVVQQKKE